MAPINHTINLRMKMPRVFSIPAIVMWLGVGLICHLMFLGSSFDWSNVWTFVWLFAWPLLFGLVLMLIAGVGFAIWRITRLFR